jgi:hypothetical protein
VAAAIARFDPVRFSLWDYLKAQAYQQRKINDRPDLSSERAPQKDNTSHFRKQPSDRK